MLKELDNRENDGISVTLYWVTESQYDDSIPPMIVKVSDVKNGDDFTLSCDSGSEGLHAFHHPFAARDTAAVGKVAA